MVLRAEHSVNVAGRRDGQGPLEQNTGQKACVVCPWFSLATPSRKEASNGSRRQPTQDARRAASPSRLTLRQSGRARTDSSRSGGVHAYDLVRLRLVARHRVQTLGRQLLDQLAARGVALDQHDARREGIGLRQRLVRLQRVVDDDQIGTLARPAPRRPRWRACAVVSKSRCLALTKDGAR